MADVLFCTDTFWNDYGDTIHAIDASLEVVLLVGDEPVADADLERITIAIFSSDVWPDRSSTFMGVCLRCPNLTWMQTSAAGTDHPVFDRLRSNGVQLSTGAGSTAPAIAQTVMLYLLALSRDLPRRTRDQAEHRWDPGPSIDLETMRLGVVGFGAIGHEIARLATAFGIEVVGLRRTIDPDDPYTVWGNDRFDELLGWADAIVVCAPLTDDTRGLFDAAAFGRMRPGSWFVNVGRGAIVDEAALIDALTSGHVGGAGLDVFATEPLTDDSPLWDLPNVIVTPHCSGDTASSGRRAAELGIENLRRRTAGEPLINQLG